MVNKIQAFMFNRGRPTAAYTFFWTSKQIITRSI